MIGPEAFARTISEPTRIDQFGNQWQYHSRSDHHSKVACVLILIDLIETCSLLADHVRNGIVGFGINHEMRDFRQDRKKNLDLVVCRPASGSEPSGVPLASFARDWKVALTPDEELRFLANPMIRSAPVGSVLIALEAKACMTAHQKALPRLFDELNSSQLTVHGATENALAAGFVCINAARSYISPDRNKRPLAGAPTVTTHRQPRDTEITIDKVHQLPRRVRESESGNDALGIVVVDCQNDGSPVNVVRNAPAPTLTDIYHYERMIDRLAASYAARFRHL